MPFSSVHSLRDTPTAEALARSLGGKKAYRAGSGWLTLCPAHDDRTPSLSIRIVDHRLLVHCFAGCEQMAVLGAMNERGAQPVRTNNLARKPKLVAPRSDRGRSDIERLSYAMRAWSEACPISGGLAELYLTKHRNLDVTRLGDLSHCLRWHAGKQALVGLMTDPISGERVGLHRTFLAADGRKVERKMLGRQGVLRLSPDADATLALGLSEGLEDGLAVLLSGWAPVWVAASAGGVAKFPVLAGIGSLTIFADPDGAGMKAAGACCERWRAQGREVVTALPPHSEVAP